MVFFLCQIKCFSRNPKRKEEICAFVLFYWCLSKSNAIWMHHQNWVVAKIGKAKIAEIAGKNESNFCGKDHGHCGWYTQQHHATTCNNIRQQHHTFCHFPLKSTTWQYSIHQTFNALTGLGPPPNYLIISSLHIFKGWATSKHWIKIVFVQNMKLFH